MNVPCIVHEIELENDDGLEIDSVQAVCTRCGHYTESFRDRATPQVRRCLVLLRTGCPKNERNFYEVEE